MLRMDPQGTQEAKHILTGLQCLMVCGLGIYIAHNKTTCVEAVWLDISPLVIIEELIHIMSFIFLVIIKYLKLSEFVVKRCHNIVLGITIVMALSLIYLLTKVFQQCSNLELLNLLSMIIAIGVGILGVPICGMLLFCCP